MTSAPIDNSPIYSVSVAAKLAGVHAQTLRQYDRLGLVVPARTRGGGRRYTPQDVDVLREVQRLSQQEGISLEGIRRIRDLEHQVRALQDRVRELTDELREERRSPTPKVFAVGPDGQITALRPEQARRVRSERSALVLWRDPSA